MISKTSARIGISAAIIAVLAGAAWPCACACAWAGSVFTSKLDDPRAVYLAAGAFGAAGDGVADDSAALQSAIDKAENHTHEGLVFVASGRYRITHTIYVWPGVRVIGYGTTRPVVVLGSATPGFQKGFSVMVMFTGPQPADGPQAARVPFPPQGSVPP